MVDTRQKVIEAAIQSFSMFGYKGTTMDKVAKLADVGKGTIYLYFASKDELFHHILAGIAEEIRNVAEEALAGQRPFFEELEQAIRQVLQFRSKHELLVKLALEAKALGTTKVLEGLEGIDNAVIRFLSGELRRGQEQGDVADCNPEVVAYVMLRTYFSLVTEYANRMAPISDEEIQQTFHQVFVRGLTVV